MSDIQECLATFAVAAWANNDDAKPKAINAIEAYIASGPTDAEASKLRLVALKDAFAELRLDSTLAQEISGAIERRIRVSEGEAPGAGALPEPEVRP